MKGDGGIRILAAKGRDSFSSPYLPHPHIPFSWACRTGAKSASETTENQALSVSLFSNRTVHAHPCERADKVLFEMNHRFRA